MAYSEQQLTKLFKPVESIAQQIQDFTRQQKIRLLQLVPELRTMLTEETNIRAEQLELFDMPWQRLYQNAAVARTEKRYNDARSLYHQAIEAGGGIEVLTALIKMEKEDGKSNHAIQTINDAIHRFPDHANFYVMYGHLERRKGQYQEAENIFRQGLERVPDAANLQMGLAQTLVQIGTTQSMKEAGQIFIALHKKGKLNSDDAFYKRYKALENNWRPHQAYDFFRQANISVHIARKQALPEHITDLVVELKPSLSLNDSFGLTGSFLVRCFSEEPRSTEINELTRFLSLRKPQEELALLEGDQPVMLHSSLAFIAVPNTSIIRDQVFSLLSENKEAIIPLDDSDFQSNREALEILNELLNTYLGRRDLYASHLPVYGRRFFGREQLLSQLTDDLNRGQFLGIYGLRKMGKTSLVNQLQEQKLSESAVAYLDLQSTAALDTKTCAPLYWELERDLYHRLHKLHPAAADFFRLGKIERFTELPDAGRQAALFFKEDIRAFLDALSEGFLPKMERLVIILDELEKILPITEQSRVDGYLEFFGMLRGLAQTERYRHYLSCMVVATNAAISERGYWEGRENPVFSFFKPIFLSPLTKEECTEMVRTLGKGMGVYWDEAALSLLFSETNGHPYLTRVLCSRLINKNPPRPLNVTDNMVQEQINPFIRDEGDKLDQIMELLNTHFPEEKKILEQIALAETVGEFPDEALSHLFAYHLIRRSPDNRYEMILNLLRRRLRRRAGLRE